MITAPNTLSFGQGNNLPLGQRIDWTLLCIWLVLLSVGLVMVASASISFSAASVFTHNDGWYFAKRHAVYLVLGLILAMVVVAVPISIWEKYASHFLMITLFLLLIVLIPGIGHRVNGSRRWLNLGFTMVQTSEIAKVCAIIFFASFFSRRYQE